MSFQPNILNVFMAIGNMALILFLLYHIKDMFCKAKALQNYLNDVSSHKYSREELNNAFNNGATFGSGYVFHFDVKVNEIGEDYVKISKKEFDSIIEKAVDKINEKIYKIPDLHV